MSQPTPARCHHSFPDPYPAPLTHIGNCRHCGTSYHDARAAMNPAVTQATEAAHNDGPSVTECRDADRAHWTTKYDRP